MHEIARFLSRYPPFDTLGDDALIAVAERAAFDSFAAAAAILESAGERSEHAYVVRSGSVELLIGGRLFDVLGAGEMFGFASLLGDEPLGFVARAGDDGAELLRFPEAAIRPVLERPEAVRFVARTLSAGIRLLAEGPAAAAGPRDRRVGELVRAPAVVCSPETSVRDAAALMVDAGATCVVVELGGALGIVTDRDIRTRVLAEGAGGDAPLADVMSAPAWTFAADRSGTEALMEMLDHGIRHLPVLDAARGLVGVLDDVDLMASERRAPFRLRGLVARAATVEAVTAAARELPATLIALHDAGQAVAAIGRTLSSLHDSIARRLIELAHAELGPPPVPYTWLATGSFGRREPFPSSDVDCALAWEDAPRAAGGRSAAASAGRTAAPAGRAAGSAAPSLAASAASRGVSAGDAEVSAWMAALAERVLAGLAACGFVLDQHGALASKPLFARSVTGWSEAALRWVDDPDRDRGLVLLSVVVESDPVWGTTRVPEALADAFARAPGRAAMLRRLAAAALAERPPTGFLRDFVLHSTGERKGVLDIKRGGLLPIESLARWGGLAAGVAAASTRARLDAAEAAGTLAAADTAILRDAFELISALRMEHQIEQLRGGRRPDDLIAPKALTPLTRSALKDAFRAVARVQRGIAVGLGLSPR